MQRNVSKDSMINEGGFFQASENNLITVPKDDSESSNGEGKSASNNDKNRR